MTISQEGICSGGCHRGECYDDISGKGMLYRYHRKQEKGGGWVP